MSAAGMSLGVDYNFGLYDANTGTVIKMGDVQQITMTHLKHDVKSMPYNANPRYAHVPDGYQGTFRLIRTGPALENLQLALNARFNTGTPMLPGFINETVIEPNNTVSKYQYINVDFTLVDVGDISREKNVTQTVHWFASDKVQLL